jgi:hypothetical protein
MGMPWARFSALRNVGGRAIGLSATILVSLGAAAQTAPFKCPQPGLVAEYSNNSVATWVGQEGNYCKRDQVNSRGERLTDFWFAPAFWFGSTQMNKLPEQLKPWTLWPLAVGKKISTRFEGYNSSGGQGSWDVTLSVDSYEKITTKAGTFDAFVVSRVDESLTNRFKQTIRQWYAPALGITVKTSTTDNRGTSTSNELVRVR